MKRNLILTSILIFLAFVGSSLACQRAEFGVPTCAYYTRADAVFLGKAIKVKQSPYKGEEEDNLGGRKVEFQILRNFKGAENSTITIQTNDWRAACGLRISKGEKWIIYAHYDGDKKIFKSNEGNKYNAEKGKEEIDFLKTASEGKAEISIFGRLVRDQLAPYDLEPATVTLESDKNKQTIKTNSDGTFKFSPLLAGNYKVQLQFPFKAYLEYYPTVIKDFLKEGNPTVIDYKIELKQSECSYTTFSVFRYIQ